MQAQHESEIGYAMNSSNFSLGSAFANYSFHQSQNKAS